MSHTPHSSPLNALRKNEVRQQERFNYLRKRESRQRKQQRSSPLAIYPTTTPPSSDDEAHTCSITPESYSTIEHPTTGQHQKEYDFRQRHFGKRFSSPVVPPASPPTTSDDEGSILTDDSTSAVCCGIDCLCCCRCADTQRPGDSWSKYRCDQAAESSSESDDVESDHFPRFEDTFSPESSPDLETTEQDVLWQALVEEESVRSGAPDRTQNTLAAKNTACKQVIKLYPNVFIPFNGVLTVNMFAPPKKAATSWPEVSSIRQINFLHPAFTLTLYIANDEMTSSLDLGPFTRLFYHPCFKRGAQKMVSQALLQGFDKLLRTVMRLPVLAHMVYERAYMELETGVNWLPSEEELERHWMLCGGHGWTCRKVD